MQLSMDVKNAKASGVSVFETPFKTPKRGVSAFQTPKRR
jgi:hypothetical protein